MTAISKVKGLGKIFISCSLWSVGSFAADRTIAEVRSDESYYCKAFQSMAEIDLQELDHSEFVELVCNVDGN